MGINPPQFDVKPYPRNPTQFDPSVHIELSDVHDTASAAGYVSQEFRAKRELNSCVGCKCLYLDNPEYDGIKQPIQQLAEDAVLKFRAALIGRPRGVVCYRGYDIHDDMMHVVFYLHYCGNQEHP